MFQSKRLAFGAFGKASWNVSGLAKCLRLDNTRPYSTGLDCNKSIDRNAGLLGKFKDGHLVASRTARKHPCVGDPISFRSRGYDVAKGERKDEAA
jgi:hypothetical protein